MHSPEELPVSGTELANQCDDVQTSFSLEAVGRNAYF